MLDNIKKNIEALFPSKKRKAIENWDFIMVFQEYYKQEIEIMLEKITCKQDFSWTIIMNEDQKQALFLIRFTDKVVIDMAHELKFLKKKDKLSYKFKLKDLNTMIHTTDKQKSPHIYDYLCFIRARMFPNNRLIYDQEQYSAFNKNKKQMYFNDKSKNLFTDEEELRAKYHFLLSYTEKLEKAKNEEQIVDQFREPFTDIMKRPGFIELVPVQKVSKFKVCIFGSLKDYLGPNIDCYFDFVAFMQVWLVFPMIIGLIVVAINYIFEYTAENSPFDFIYALLVMIWSILFITKWEEIQKWMQIQQNSGSSELWSQHQNMVSRRGLQRQVSPITGKIQYYLPLKMRILLGIASNGICFAELLLTIIFMIYSLNARGFIDPDHRLFYSQTVSGWSEPGGIFDKETGWGQIPNIVHVIVLNSFDEIVYRPMARVLAKFQRHKTPKGYENSIILKYFVYQFFITFADLFYIAFIRFDIQGLRQQLLSLFFIDIIRRVVAESIIPWIKKRQRSKSVKKSAYDKKQMTVQEELKFGAIIQVNKQEYEPFDDYLEIITNLGYLVMISSCFPLAPLLIIIAHGVQLMQDKYKIIHIFKRKLPQKYVGMGRWKNIIVFLCYISIITNILLFAFSSKQVVSLFPRLFENGKDLIYGNTDLSTLFGGAANDVLTTMLDLSSSTAAAGSLLSGIFDSSGEQSVGMNTFQNMFAPKENNTLETQTMPNLLFTNQNTGQKQAVDDGWGDFDPNALKVNQKAESIDQKADNGWGDFDPNAFKANQQVDSADSVNMLFGGNPPLAKAPLQLQVPQTVEQETQLIALLFFIEHFFLIGFILLRNSLAKKRSASDIFLERRQHKRRIKKNLPKNILKLLSGGVLIHNLFEKTFGGSDQKQSKNDSRSTANTQNRVTLDDFRLKDVKIKKTASEQEQEAHIISQILKRGQKLEQPEANGQKQKEA